MFETLLAGETVTASVNAAASYKLTGVLTADITAVQSFQYAVGTVAPTALAGLLSCSAVSSTVSITPDQDTVAA